MSRGPSPYGRRWLPEPLGRLCRGRRGSARYRQQQALIYEEFGGPPPGYLAHTCARTEDGLLITNLVESEEAVWETRPRFAKTAEAVGLPEPSIQLYPVVNALAQQIEPSTT